MDKQITTLKDLKSYAEGAIVELPPFGPGQPFVARVRRPSLMKLAKNGDIPNTLLATAAAMFDGKSSPKDVVEGENLKNIIEVCECMGEACFIEPTWNELQEAGIELTDDQYIYIFNYTQGGVQSLAPFREEQQDRSGDIHGGAVSRSAE